MTRHYEAAVIGGRLSAVIAAALFAKRGLRTLLVDQGELASADQDLVDDLVPSPADSGVMQKVHDELGLRLETEPRLHPVHPALQVVFPDQRVELSPDRPALLEELRRERAGRLEGATNTLDRLDGGARAVGAFLSEAQELPASGFFGRRAAAQLVRRHEGLGNDLAKAALLDGAPPELSEALLALLPFVTHFDAPNVERVTAARLCRPVSRWLRGLGRLELPTGLRGLFLEVAEKRAFDLHRGAIARLEPASKQITLELVQSKEEITADVVIDASTDLSGIDTIPGRLRKKELSLALQAAKPRGHLHVIGVSVDRAALPPGMGRHLLLLNGRRGEVRDDGVQSLEDRPILVCRRAAEEGARDELICAHPVSAVRQHAEGLDQLEAAMRARLTRLIPFLEHGRPEVQTMTGRGATQDRRPMLPHPLYDPDLDPELGLTGVGLRTPYRSVFLAGPAVLPGLGVEGEYWSALQAVEASVAYRSGGRMKKRLLE